MITKQEFDLAAKSVVSNMASVLPKMISSKSYIQKAVLNVATRQELEDVRDSRINQGLIDKLCKIAKMSGCCQLMPSLSTALQWR